MRLAAFLAVLALGAPLSAAPAPAPYGILLLAHGGDASWNKEIESLRARVNAKVPAEIAIGMADPKALQAGVDLLEKRGVKRIVAVPLFIQTRSEVLDQTRYALGLADKPSEVLRAGLARMAAAHAHHMAGGHGHSMEFSTERVKAKEPVALARALDDHALVGRILNERAKALAGKAAKAHLVLVAHGPVDDAAVPVWMGSLSSLCAMAAEGGTFVDCAPALLRDDAAPEVRAAAVADLREKVSRAKLGKQGPVVVVPVLVARGGIETKIPKDLEGLDYAWDGRTLMPHAGFDAWVLERAAAADSAGRP
jgi:sirohydrochlorin ferrochelatase